MRPHTTTDAEIYLPFVRLTERILTGDALPIGQPRISWPRHIPIWMAGHSQSTPAFSPRQEAIPVRVRICFSHDPQDA